MSKTPNLRQNRTLPDLLGAINRPKVEPETGWHKVGSGPDNEINFQGSWVNTTDATDAPASWYIDEHGEVKLRGGITGGSVGSTIMTLPEEARPEFVETFVVSSNSGVLNLSPIRFRAYQAGDA